MAQCPPKYAFVSTTKAVLKLKISVLKRNQTIGKNFNIESWNSYGYVLINFINL